MSKVETLYETDREMMLEFSRLCTGRLNRHLPLKLFLSPFQRFFDANVLKEIEKDRLIIEHAIAAHENGKDRADVDLDKLFEMTIKVDKEFLKKLSTPFFKIEIRYDDLAQVRKKRMLSFVNMVFDLLCNWHSVSPFADIVKSTYAEQNYREILGEFLHLYNVETRLLSNSITVHGPAGTVKELFAEKLFVIMEETAQDIAVAYTRKIYVGNGRSSVSRI
ncbi:MAG: hypothetical protein WA610_05775 [Thermodesulfovibrionales bacterium]